MVVSILYRIGSTVDLERGVQQHVKGKCHTTARMLPVELVFSQKFESLTEARSIENRLKQMKLKDIIQRVIPDGRIKLTI